MARPVIHAPGLHGAGGWINTVDELTLTELRGRIVVLDFWTSCCVNCQRMVGELRPIEREYGGAVVVIGVHSPKFTHERDHATVVHAVARHRITHPVLDDPRRVTWDNYAIRAWPTVVVIDPDGYVVRRVAGEGQLPALREVLDGLIDEHGLDELRSEPSLGGTGRSPGDPGDPSVLSYPGKVAARGDGMLAVADTGNDAVLVISSDGVVIRRIGGLDQPQGVCFVDDALVVCDTGADRVLAIDLATGASRELARMAAPWDVARDGHGGLVVAEAGRHRLWRIGPDGPPEVVAGTGEENLVDGPGPSALLAQPSGVARSAAGIVFVDAESSSLRRLRDDGEVETLVGTGLFSWGDGDGDRETARLQHPLGVTVIGSGAGGSEGIYLADSYNNRLRVWRDGQLQTLAVRGLAEPGGLDVMPDSRLVVADTNHHRILLVDPRTGALDELNIRDKDGPSDPAAT